MSVASELYKVNVVGDGSTPSIAFNRKVFNSTDIKGIKYDTTTSVETALVNGTDFTVAGAGETSSSVTITPSAAIPTGTNWVLYSDAGSTQSTTLTTAGEFPAKSLEYAFDKLAIGTQEADGKADRALKLPISDTASSEIPVAALRASKYLSFDASGNVVATSSPANGYLINVKDYGAAGDGTTDDTAPINLAIAAWQALGNNAVLMFPDGKYVGTNTITTASTYSTIRGAGPHCTELSGIKIKLAHAHTSVENLHLSGAASYGVLLESASGIADTGRRFCSVRDCYIRGRTIGLSWTDAGGYFTCSNCNIFNNGTNVKLNGNPAVNYDNGDARFNNCYFMGATTDYGMHVLDFGTLHLTDCKFQSNNTYGLYIEHDDVTYSTYGIVQVFWSNCSAEDCGRTRTLSISGVTNSGGDAVFTTGTHLLETGMSDIDVTGTTNYNGTGYQVEVINDTTFYLLVAGSRVAYVANETGTASLKNWDIYIDVASGSSNPFRQGRFDFIGGDANYVYLGGVTQAKFDLNLKYQIYVEPECKSIQIFHRGGKRVYNGVNNQAGTIPISGTTTDNVFEMEHEYDANTNDHLSVLGTAKSNIAWDDDQMSVNTTALTINGQLEGTKGFRSFEIEIADDSVGTIDVSSIVRGIVLITRGTDANGAAMVVYKTDTSAVTSSIHLGSGVEISTGVLTGTTGTDNKYTVSAHTDNLLYIENRLGNTITFKVTILCQN
jgi:hypothetical protein